MSPGTLVVGVLLRYVLYDRPLPTLGGIPADDRSGAMVPPGELNRSVEHLRDRLSTMVLEVTVKKEENVSHERHRHEVYRHESVLLFCGISFFSSKFMVTEINSNPLRSQNASYGQGEG